MSTSIKYVVFSLQLCGRWLVIYSTAFRSY